MTFGALKSKKDIREYRVSSIKPNSIEIPNEYELTMPEVKNQDSTGSCVAHSLSTIIEYFNMVQEQEYKQFSTGYIYGNRRNTDYYGSGMYVDKAINAVVKWGDVYNEKFNYNIEVPDAIAKFEEQAFELAPDAYPHRFSEFYRLDTDEERKLHLMQYGPIIFSIAWYKDYYVDKKTKVLTHLSNEIAGYHCMVIYGWNELGWKFQNSWGTTFGNRGRAILPYNTEFDTCYGIKDNITSKINYDAIDKLTAQLLKVEKQLAEKTAELETLETEKQENQEQIKALKQQISELNLMLVTYRDEIERLKQLEEELLEIEKPFKNMPAWLAKIINFILNLFK